MTANNDKEPTIIDVEPEPEYPEEAPQDSAAASRPGKPLPLPLIIAVVALVLVAVGLMAGYSYWAQLRSELQALDQRIATTRSQQEEMQDAIQSARRALDDQREMVDTQRQDLEAQSAAFAAQDDKLENEREQLKQEADTIRQAMADVQERVGRSSGQWMVAEAEYLMRIANHRLKLARDPLTALAALGLADERLRDSGDPGWIGVREELAREMAALKALQMPDTAGLAAELQGLGAQSAQLKLTLGTLNNPAEAARATGEETDKNLKSMLKDGLQGFGDLMRIRRHDKPVSAMLPPEQQYFLFQNLRLQLEAARIALLRGETELYRSSLATAAEWLEEYFDTEDPGTRATLEAIRRLSAAELRPALPDISGSLRALQRLREERESRS